MVKAQKETPTHRRMAVDLAAGTYALDGSPKSLVEVFHTFGKAVTLNASGSSGFLFGVALLGFAEAIHGEALNQETFQAGLRGAADDALAFCKDQYRSPRPGGAVEFLVEAAERGEGVAEMLARGQKSLEREPPTGPERSLLRRTDVAPPDPGMTVLCLFLKGLQCNG